jgi:murein DD-endopeptidase MepM/ murein hydrolase activator NlpD
MIRAMSNTSGTFKKIAWATLTPILLIGGAILLLMSLIGGFLMSLHKEAPPQVDLENTEWIITAEGKKLIPAEYLPVYERIGKKYGVPWNLLAAIHKVETDFGRNLSTSWAGAVGHFQSMPCNWLGWNAYKSKCDSKGDFLPGVHIDLTDPKNLKGGQAVDENGDGKIDPNNLEDSMATAAKRLAVDKKRTKKGWFERGGAVWRYNPSSAYVNKVEKYFHLFAKAKNPDVLLASNLEFKGGKYPWPTKGVLTSPFGKKRTLNKKDTYTHKGIDIGAPEGTPIYAMEDGVVTRSKSNPGGFGWYVVISHGKLDGKNVETWYGHMYPKTVKVKVGQKVKQGQIIAEVGNNGRSSGPHLHFEVRVDGVPQNPLKYIKK